MKIKTYYYVGICLFLLFGNVQKANAQLVTKHYGVQPEYRAGFSHSKLVWGSDYAPLSYSEHAVTKFSANGSSIVYNKSYELDGHDANFYFDVQEINEHYIFSTYNELFATDMGGNPTWAIRPESHAYTAKIQALCKSNDNEILVFQAAEKYGETYLAISKIESATGSLMNYTEYHLHIPTDVSVESVITTATHINGHGYFLTLSSSTREAYTLSLDYGLSLMHINKQNFYRNGNWQPLNVHEILPTTDGQMFFIESLNDGSLSTPNGAIIGKLNFDHDFITIKYIEPSNSSNYFSQMPREKGVIVETEESVFVNLDVEGSGTIATRLDGVTYGLKYYDGRKHLAALVQYDVNMNVLAQTVAYDYGAENDMVLANNIITDYTNRIQMKIGISDNPSYVAGHNNDSYYNVITPDDLHNNCYATSLEVNEENLDYTRDEIGFGYSDDELRLREVDITETNLDFDSAEDCERERSITVSPTELKTTATQHLATVYPNPSTGNVLVTFTAAKNGTLEVYNTAGKLIRTNQLIANQTTTLQNLNKGVYMLVITDSEGSTTTEKVIVTD